MQPYFAKLCCENCGKIDFYKLPFGTEFIAYDNEYGEATESGYGRGEESQYVVLDCLNCGLPHLRNLAWDASEQNNSWQQPPNKEGENGLNPGDRPS